MATPKTIVLITGANQGVGYECAKYLALAAAHYHILLGSRDPARGADAVKTLEQDASLRGTVESLTIDVTSDASIDAAAEAVADKHGRLDVLVNNAGILAKQLTDPREAIRAILETNVIGAVSTTEAFLPLLRKASAPRLVFVSSSMGSITHAATKGSPYYAGRASEYRASKAALNMLMVQYHKNLDGFKVFGADPGLVASNFMDKEAVRAKGAPEASVGGKTVAEVVMGERDEDVGKVCGRYGVSEW